MASFSNKGDGGKGRQPWIPSADIQAFDDIFNSVDNTRAQELSSTSTTTAASSSTNIISCAATIIVVWMYSY